MPGRIVIPVRNPKLMHCPRIAGKIEAHGSVRIIGVHLCSSAANNRGFCEVLNCDGTSISLSEQVLGAGFLDKLYKRSLLRDLGLVACELPPGTRRPNASGYASRIRLSSSTFEFAALI